MNPFKKLQYYFIGGALAKTDDVFEQVKAEVLFNFTFFFIFTNIPYLFVAYKQTVQLTMVVSTIAALVLGLIVIKKTGNIKWTTYFFFLNFFIQDIGHFVLDNGKQELQGVLYAILFIASGFLLMDRKWGFAITLLMVTVFILGIHNINTNFSVFHVPDGVGDQPEEGALHYLALIPLLLNAYLISEFVKARQKAEKQLSEQKTLIEEKQKEILDSIHYALRIQKSLLPTDVYIEKSLERINKKQ